MEEAQLILFLGVKSEKSKGERVVVFYDTRLVVAVIDKVKRKADVKQYKEKLKSEKVGFWERLEAVEKYRKNYGKRYADKAAEELLAEHPKNYTLTYEDILKVKYVKCYEEIDIHNGNYLSEGYIEIDTLKEKYHIEHQHEQNVDLEKGLIRIFKNRILIE